MTQNLTLVTQKPFGSLTCNFYKDDAIENEFYMTRRQIGEALGYVKADDAIQQIHDRNKDRLDPLSTTLTLGGVEGNRWVNRNTRVYTLRGVMEICRLPEAKFGLGRTVCSKLSGVQSWVSHFTTLFPAGIVSPEGVHSVGALVLYGSTIYSVRCILFNCINPDRITPQQMFFSTI